MKTRVAGTVGNAAFYGSQVDIGDLDDVFRRQMIDPDPHRLRRDLEAAGMDVDAAEHEETRCPVCGKVHWPAWTEPMWKTLWWPCLGDCEAWAIKMGWKRSDHGPWDQPDEAAQQDNEPDQRLLNFG